MRKCLVILFLFLSIVVYSQEEEPDLSKFNPTVAWRTKVRNVTMQAENTFVVEVKPLDWNEPGAATMTIGNYLIDYGGFVFNIIDSTETTITVVNLYKNGIGPQIGRTGIVYKSVGKGESIALAPVYYSYLSPYARENMRRYELEVLWDAITDTIKADEVFIDDFGEYFDSLTVEGALQEGAQALIDTALKIREDMIDPTLIQFLDERETIITDSDNKYPTSGAVVDYAQPILTPGENISIIGNVISAILPEVTGNESVFNGWDKNADDDFSGDYLDLTNKPIIPTVNNTTISLQRNGVNIGDFTTNQATPETFNFIDENTQLSQAQVNAYEEDPIALDSINRNLRPDINLNTVHRLADNDLSSTNELQTLSKIGLTVTLSNGGGSFIDEVDDADNDPYNELDNTDDQQLVIDSVGRVFTISLEDGGNVTFEDTNTQLSDPEIAAFGYIKNYTVTESDVTQHQSALQITESQITDLVHFTNADETDQVWLSDRVNYATKDYVNSRGFITGYTETDPTVNNPTITFQRNGVSIGFFTLNQPDNETFNFIDNDTQLSDGEIAALGYIKNYTVTESDVTQHQSALQITESQITDLVHFTNADETDQVWLSDRVNYATKDYVNSRGFITGYTETDPTVNNPTITFQRNGVSIGFFTLNQPDNETFNFIDNDTQLSDGEIAALGYIKNYTVTESDVTQHQSALQITESQITDLVHFTNADETDQVWLSDRVNYATKDYVNSRGFITGYTETDPTVNNPTITLQRNGVSIGNLTLNQPDNETFNFIDENTQLSDGEIAAFGYVKLGETSGKAYRGDRGKIAYDHSQIVLGNPHDIDKTDVGLGNVENAAASTLYEPIFSKNTAFNKNFGTTVGTVAQGNDSRILNGQTAYRWGDHSLAGYLTSYTETDPLSLHLTGGTLSGPLTGTTIKANNYFLSDEYRSVSNQQLVINAGESFAYATGQIGESVYINAEGGLVVTSSPNNWQSATPWNDRNTTIIGASDGSSTFGGPIKANTILLGYGSVIDNLYRLDINGYARAAKIHANGQIITSNAALQVNGFMRTGNIYLHQGGNTPNASEGILGNVSNNLVWNTNIIWHQGNDGPGSGLHADLVDGLHVNKTASNAIMYRNASNRTYAADYFVSTNLTDVTNDAPWYGLGKSNLIMSGEASATVQLGGYFGINLKTGAHELRIPNAGSGGDMLFDGSIVWDASNFNPDDITLDYATANGNTSTRGAYFESFVQAKYSGNSGYTQIGTGGSGGYIAARNSVGTETVTIRSYGTSEFDFGVTALNFIKQGGTSSQFLKADGSVDENSYSKNYGSRFLSQHDSYYYMNFGRITIPSGITSYRNTWLINVFSSETEAGKNGQLYVYIRRYSDNTFSYKLDFSDRGSLYDTDFFMTSDDGIVFNLYQKVSNKTAYTGYRKYTVLDQQAAYNIDMSASVNDNKTTNAEPTGAVLSVKATKTTPLLTATNTFTADMIISKSSSASLTIQGDKDNNDESAVPTLKLRSDGEYTGLDLGLNSSNNVDINTLYVGVSYDAASIINSSTPYFWFNNTPVVNGDKIWHDGNFTDNHVNWDAAFNHITESGASHSYINQSVTTTATPTFLGLSLKNSGPIINVTATNNASGLRINTIGQTSGSLFRLQNDGSTVVDVSPNGTANLSGSVFADTYFASTDGAAVFGTNSPGTVYLRPTGYGDATAQSKFTTSLATIGTNMEVNSGGQSTINLEASYAVGTGAIISFDDPNNQGVQFRHEISDGYRSPFGIILERKADNVQTSFEPWFEVKGNIYGENIINSMTITGTSTKTISMKGQDGGTIASANFTDLQGATGTGVSGRLAYWSSSTNITSDADLTFDGLNLRVGASNESGTVNSGNFVMTSDRRFKKNIKSIKDLSIYDDVNFVQFRMKSGDKHQRYGVIAQDLEQVNSELVRKDKNGYYSVAYIDLLIAKTARQDQQIKSLEDKIECLLNSGGCKE